MFQTIPRSRPSTPLLDGIDDPADMRRCSPEELEQLAWELRAWFLYCVGRTGGHFGGNLGVVELTIALHYVLETPEDRLVWDVGHQVYPHKILTGRREDMLSMRRSGGLAPFAKRSESPYDCFGAGHSSTSISAALGMALAARATGSSRRVAAVIGDGAMTAGMAFEALQHAAHTHADLLVVLNDNLMSISHNQGGLATYLGRLWASKSYRAIREGSKKILARIPPAWQLVQRTEEHVKGLMTPGTLFEELGLNYLGPIDGHNISGLVATLRSLRDFRGPQLLHVITRKGHGFTAAEQDPVRYHAIDKLDPPPAADATIAPASKGVKYQKVFGDWLCVMAEQDERLVAITPAMKEGSGMVEFAERFADRFHDVAIAEQHAVTLAAGLACEGRKPVVAIYSTFLQRGYDQLIHDVALQNLDVLFAVDRAGIVGEDGPTHTGAFDLSFLRCIPNVVVMAPSDENETRRLLSSGYQYQGPAVVRYPRGKGPGAPLHGDLEPLPLGRAVERRAGREVALLAFGPPCEAACAVGERLDATVVDMRFVKPLDEECVLSLADRHRLLVTIEENAVAGGAGSAVQELLAAQGRLVAFLSLGISDRFVEPGPAGEVRAACGLDADSIEKAVRNRLQLLETSS